MTGRSPRESRWKGPERAEMVYCSRQSDAQGDSLSCPSRAHLEGRQVPSLSRKGGSLEEVKSETVAAVRTSWRSSVRSCRAGPRALTGLRAARGGLKNEGDERILTFLSLRDFSLPLSGQPCTSDPEN